MTKEEYINKIVRELNVDKDFATKVFTEKNKCDWAVFCSYMADDRDHPEERSEARRKKNIELEGLDKDLVESIESFMDEDEEYNIHNIK